MSHSSQVHISHSSPVHLYYSSQIHLTFIHIHTDTIHTLHKFTGHTLHIQFVVLQSCLHAQLFCTWSPHQLCSDGTNWRGYPNISAIDLTSQLQCLRQATTIEAETVVLKLHPPLFCVPWINNLEQRAMVIWPAIERMRQDSTWYNIQFTCAHLVQTQLKNGAKKIGKLATTVGGEKEKYVMITSVNKVDNKWWTQVMMMVMKLDNKWWTHECVIIVFFYCESNFWMCSSFSLICSSISLICFFAVSISSCLLLPPVFSSTSASLSSSSPCLLRLWLLVCVSCAPLCAEGDRCRFPLLPSNWCRLLFRPSSPAWSSCSGGVAPLLCPIPVPVL